jgi:hypothetical protein
MAAVESFVDRESIPAQGEILRELWMLISRAGPGDPLRRPSHCCMSMTFARATSETNNKGKLRGCDPRTNVILSDCVEREYSTDQGVEMIPLGLYMIKGDNV